MKKIDYFIRPIPKGSRVLEIGSGSGWLRDYMREGGWENYVGLDLRAPADIVGDVRDWRRLGILPGSFDVVVAFEVIEHFNCLKEIHDILVPGGRLMLTSPLPSMDWFCRSLEFMRLSQKRTSPHTNLVDFHALPYFSVEEIKVVGFLSQWGKFRRPLS
jgi:cyclopropane fatty-acyl-phospholipid synthase-like methyltransferase